MLSNDDLLLGYHHLRVYSTKNALVYALVLLIVRMERAWEVLLINTHDIIYLLLCLRKQLLLSIIDIHSTEGAITIQLTS